MDWKDQLSEIKNTLIEREEVFEAVRRGYSELSGASDDEIMAHFALSTPEELKGHVSNVKGILFEQEVQDKFESAGIETHIFEKTNHPDADMIISTSGEGTSKLGDLFTPDILAQLKSSDDPNYVIQAIEENPEIAVIATTEVANEIGNEVIDSGISNTVLEETVAETISPISIGGAILAILTGGFFG